MGKAAQIATVLVVLTMAGANDLQAAEEEAAAASFVSLKLEGACDEHNNRLWLTNSHSYKTIATTVRWRAAGGKDLTDEFFPGPNSVREIGCAAEGEIIDASFANF